MRRDTALELLNRLHAAQNEFYAGGSDTALTRILHPSITWTVPGRNDIAGVYRGREHVLDYFRRRRRLAGGTFQLKRLDVLVGEGNRVAALTDGSATIGDTEHHWSTVGLYEVTDKQVTACWLLALDQDVFDAIWSV